MSPDKENEYFSDGISEEILNSLSRLNGLHVTARTSSFAFKNKNMDVREIGRQLNVAMILEGSIRKSNNIVRITAQLTQAENGFHLWAETWDRELKDIFIVQDEIAGIIADKVNRDIERATPNAGHVIENTEALDYYLKGKYLQNKFDLDTREEVIYYYERAVQLDPNLLQAYIGLCDMYTWLSSTGFVEPFEAFSKIEQYSHKVFKINDQYPDIYRIMAGKNFWIEWNFALALSNVNKALAGKPSFPDALIQKGLILAALGKFEESLDNLFQAERLNPFDYTVNSSIGYIYRLTGEYEKAVEFLNKNIAINPIWDGQYLMKLESLCLSERYEEAWKTIETIAGIPQTSLSPNHLKSFYYACMGDKEKTMEYLRLFHDETTTSQLNTSSGAPFLAQLWFLLGNKQKALDFLEEGIENRVAPLQFIKNEQFWHDLNSHPRFISLIRKLNVSDEKMAHDIPTKKYKKTGISSEQAKAVQEKLKDVMHVEKPYLNPTLTLSDLSEKVGVSNNMLSQILNEYIGKNFYDYVNAYRLQHFQDLTKSPKHKHYTILGLAYECGFNSKTTFNTFFKKAMGKTPSAYFKANFN
ncbi:MAG: helix-turn-helix domain-containing protein [Bacteroidota bacterium]